MYTPQFSNLPSESSKQIDDIQVNLQDWTNSTFRPKFQLALAASMRLLRRDRFRESDFAIIPLEIPITNLHPEFEGYRIVHIADIHMGHWISGERLQGMVKLINNQNPDLIAITGDFVSYVVDEIEDELVKSLSQLQPQDATVAVLGNHDHWMGADKVRPLLEKSNVIELANDVYTVQRNHARLYIAGVDDIIVGQERLDLVLDKLPSGGPAVLLAHEPDFADTSAATGRFGLQLSGHSHGGQIVWPGIGPLIRGPGFMKYPVGKYHVEDMIQYTTRGVGTHVFRLRFNCPPEITVINLIGD